MGAHLLSQSRFPSSQGCAPSMAPSKGRSNAQLVIGLDVGTSAVKVGSFELSGKMQAISVREHPLDSDGTVVVQHPENTWRVIVDAVREVVTHSSGEFVAIAISNQRGSIVPIDTRGRALSPVIVWMDRRGLPWLCWIEEQVGRDFYYREAGHPIVPYTGISKLIALQRSQPDLFDNATSIAPPQTLLLRKLGAE